MRVWLEQDREFLTWRSGFWADIRRWQELAQDPGALLHGALLDQAKAWLERQRDKLSEREQNYIQVSLKHEFDSWRKNLEPKITNWKNAKYGAVFLLQEDTLDEAEKWYLERSEMLNKREIDYIKASLRRRNLVLQGSLRKTHLRFLVLYLFLVISSILSWFLGFEYAWLPLIGSMFLLLHGLLLFLLYLPEEKQARKYLQEKKQARKERR